MRWVIAIIAAALSFLFAIADVSVGGAEELKLLVPSPELRQLIVKARMVPWSWRPVPLDETLWGLNRKKVQLREFITGSKPLLVYMYAQW